MRKLYLLLLTFLVSSTVAFASLETIEQNMSACLKGLMGNIPMANCAIKASSETEKEINSILPKMQTINHNQDLWKLYKNSTEDSVNSLLQISLGTMYYLFAKNNTYEMNYNRLFILNNLNNNIPYKQERFLSNRLENCLSKSSTNLDKEKCYIKESEWQFNEIESHLKQLQSKLSKEEYNKLKNNQSAWLNYKNDIEKILNNEVSNLIKAQIMKNIYTERNGQLLDLVELYRYK